MFKDTVGYKSPFTYDSVRNHYQADGHYFDDTLAMTMSILFYKRVPDFKIYADTIHWADFAEDKIDNDPSRLSFLFVGWCRTDPDEKLSGNYISFPHHEQFFKENFNYRIRIRYFTEKNTVCVFAGEHDMALFHGMQTFIPVYFSKYFENAPVTQEETSILRSLILRSPTEYVKLIQNFCNNHEDFLQFLLRNKIIGFEKTILQTKIRNIDEKVNELQTAMDAALDSYRRSLEKKNELSIMRLGLEEKESSTNEDTELEEYLCLNKNLTNIFLTENKIMFIVKTYALPYLPDIWETLSDRGNIFKVNIQTTNCLNEKDNRKLLLDAIFSRNHVLKLKMCAFFDLNFNSSAVSSVRNYNFEEENPSLKDYIPNPHLNLHNCFGQNMVDIMDNIASGDIIGAIETCINAAKRINVNEKATFVPLMETLMKFNGKCIVTPDGKELTPEQAVMWLKGEKNEKVSDGTGENSAA